MKHVFKQRWAQVMVLSLLTQLAGILLTIHILSQIGLALFIVSIVMEARYTNKRNIKLLEDKLNWNARYQLVKSLLELVVDEGVIDFKKIEEYDILKKNNSGKKAMDKHINSIASNEFTYYVKTKHIIKQAKND